MNEERGKRRMEMTSKAVRVECVLRMLSVVLTLMAALLVGLDTQTKTLFFARKTATFRDLDALRSVHSRYIFLIDRLIE